MSAAPAVISPAAPGWSSWRAFYDIPSIQIEYVRNEESLTRASGAVSSPTAQGVRDRELHELAAAARTDPVDYRRKGHRLTRAQRKSGYWPPEPIN